MISMFFQIISQYGKEKHPVWNLIKVSSKNLFWKAR